VVSRSRRRPALRNPEADPMDCPLPTTARKTSSLYVPQWLNGLFTSTVHSSCLNGSSALPQAHVRATMAHELFGSICTCRNTHHLLSNPITPLPTANPPFSHSTQQMRLINPLTIDIDACKQRKKKTAIETLHNVLCFI